MQLFDFLAAPPGDENEEDPPQLDRGKGGNGGGGRGTSPGGGRGPTQAGLSPQAPSEAEEERHLLRVGDRVVIANDPALAGTVRFLGDVDFSADSLLAGVELDAAAGRSDGTYEGKKYFSCRMNHGLFVRPELLMSERELGRRRNPAAAARVAQVQRLIAAALDARDFRRVLNELLPQAVILGVDSSDLAEAATIARDAVAADPAGSDQLQDLVPGRALMHRYRAVQDAVALLTRSVAGLESVMISPQSVNADLVGEPVKAIGSLDRGLKGTWVGDEEEFTISEQVGEGDLRLLYFEQELDDRRLSSWLSRRDSKWLVGELCNTASKDVVGMLRVNQDVNSKYPTVTYAFKQAGSTEWDEEVVAARSTSKAAPPAALTAESQRGDATAALNAGTSGADHSGSSSRLSQPKQRGSLLGGMFGARKPEMEQVTPSLPKRSSSLMGNRRLTVPADGIEVQLASILEAVKSVQESLQQSQARQMDLDLSPVLQEIRALADKAPPPASAPATGATELAELLQAVNDVRDSVRERQGQPLAVDLGPVLQEIQDSTGRILEARGDAADGGAAAKAVEPVHDAVRDLCSEVRAARSEAKQSLEELARHVREAGPAGAGTVVGEAATPELQRYVEEMHKMMHSEISTKTVVHEYFTMLQTNIKNNCGNIQPALEAVKETQKKNQKALLKKIEESAQGGVQT